MDYGFDSQLQDNLGAGTYTAMVSEIYEADRWHASQALGNASQATDWSTHFKATVDYLYDKTYGGDLQYFSINGRASSSHFRSWVFE